MIICSRKSRLYRRSVAAEAASIHNQTGKKGKRGMATHISVLCARRKRTQNHGFRSLGAFLNDIESVDCEISEYINLAGRPANFEQIHCWRLVQTEMQA